MAKFSVTGKTMRIKIMLFLIVTMLTLTSCLTYDLSRRIVQQGNLLPQSKIEKLHVGMSKEQVALLMGTSMLSPLFNNDRWDYAYTRRVGGGPLIVRNVILYFSHDKVSRIEHHP
jgi:outer membrane protein assembly factor BamE